MPHASPRTAAPAQETPIDQLSFEGALAELEQIVRGLESGQMPLEETISAYERGAALRRHCETRLEEAEMRVRAIVRNGAQDLQDIAGNGADGEAPPGHGTQPPLEDLTLSPSRRPGEESRA
ncbi:exodeoxyribonuclease VII small subunit [Oecophyllibacter saccharovorans]|uniref:Exodeoxyribonuclease 7 small subunit n=1 Tax=Oecophyllibacter saccharovorans TaxID=2558360 RepID=A0A506UR84_9PROT|nr:exodeoxyribonuclease VII small subunit [Oecophyllibacter saccharovorans]TPW35861.1 exodeoxyribonuclease VII small subunit [Oecophyllibacter saccharovorans]